MAASTRGMSEADRNKAQEKLLLSDRYVDDKGKALPDGTKHPYAEFKMMPIDLHLEIDQTKIPALLAHSANFKNADPGARRKAAAGNFASAEPGVHVRRDAWGRSRGARRPRWHDALRAPARRHRGRRAAAASDSGGSIYLPIEVQGIIYIYNPPKLERLGTGAVAKGAASTPAPAVPAKGATP